MRLSFLVMSLLACGGEQSAAATQVAARAEPAFVPAPEHVFTVESPDYHIDRKYRSMFGPDALQNVKLVEGPPELVWITGYTTEVVDAATGERLSQEFMCHANLDLDVQRYYEVFPTRVPLSGRVFTLSQGQQDIRMPEGFGIPTWTGDPLKLTTQVLNLNLENPDLKVKHRVTVRYVRDSETKSPMKPLFQAAVQGFKSLGDARHYGLAADEVNAAQHGDGCSPGMSAVPGDEDADDFGQKFTAHWIVEPGREENRTNVTRFLNLPYDTTAHYIAVHLHPFAESLELIDRTTGESLFKSTARNSTDHIGLDHIEWYESKEGLPLYKTHEYELVSVYNNTSPEAVDSMAVMYLYLLDKTFGKPDLATLTKPLPDPGAPQTNAPTGM